MSTSDGGDSGQDGRTIDARSVVTLVVFLIVSEYLRGRLSDNSYFSHFSRTLPCLVDPRYPSHRLLRLLYPECGSSRPADY